MSKGFKLPLAPFVLGILFLRDLNFTVIDILVLIVKYALLLVAEISFLILFQRVVSGDFSSTGVSLLLAAFLLRFVVVIYAFYGVSAFGQQVATRIRMRTLDRLCGTGFKVTAADFDSKDGRWLDQISRQSQLVGVSVIEPLMRSMLDLFLLCCLLGYALFLDPLVVGIVILGVTVVNLAFSRLSRNRITTAGTTHANASVRIAELVMALVSNALSLKLSRRVLSADRAFESANKDLAESHARGATWAASSRYVLEFGLLLSAGLAIMFWNLLDPTNFSSVGIYERFAVLGLIAMRGIPLANSVVTARTQWNFGKRAFFKSWAAVKRRGVLPASKLVEGLDVTSVSFRIQQGHKTYSASVGFNKPLLIHGASGAGKSSVLQCLLVGSAYNTTLINLEVLASDGSIFDQSNGLSTYLRVGLMRQGSRLIPASIYENICLESPTPEQETRVASLIRIFELDRHIPQALSTQVSEDYGLLSQGQKQRVFLVRAFCCADKIVILDEPTSALDGESSTGTLEKILSLSDRYLIVCVSHDPIAKIIFSNKLEII